MTTTRAIPSATPSTSQGVAAAAGMSIAAQHLRAIARCPRVCRRAASAGGVDLLRVAAQQHGHLIDDDVADQVGEVLAVVRPDLQRAPVDHDPRRYFLPVLP